MNQSHLLSRTPALQPLNPGQGTTKPQTPIPELLALTVSLQPSYRHLQSRTLEPGLQISTLDSAPEPGTPYPKFQNSGTSASRRGVGPGGSSKVRSWPGGEGLEGMGKAMHDKDS
mmetsp:Transcript_48670/g.75992  ORF Transcript_48670/g.75992 Transcript_48670/m.75992 type:complete len:115 (+) Transcript_48670:246-590(+)